METLNGSNIPDMLPEILRLYARSPLHRVLTTADIVDWTLPPISLRQFAAMWDVNTGVVLGYAAWAFANDEAHEALRTGSRALRYHEWRSGEHLWVTDFVAPGHAQLLTRILRRLAVGQGLGGTKVNFVRRYSKKAPLPAAPIPELDWSKEGAWTPLH